MRHTATAVVVVAMTFAAFVIANECAGNVFQKDCELNRHCSWCGHNVTNATGHPTWGFCYDPAVSTGECCAAALPDPGAWWFCTPFAQLCGKGTKCVTAASPTTYGNCPAAQCCAADVPQLCGDRCIAADAHCCGDSMFCNVTQACCGTGGLYDSCCPEKANCCVAPDGEGAWCCPQPTQCTITPYFGCTKNAAPINMRKLPKNAGANRRV